MRPIICPYCGLIINKNRNDISFCFLCGNYFKNNTPITFEKIIKYRGLDKEEAIKEISYTSKVLSKGDE